MANQVDSARAVTVKLDLTPGPALIEAGHDSRLAQVLNNLIDNARSFSVPGGSVRVAFRETFFLVPAEPGQHQHREVSSKGQKPGIRRLLRMA